MNFRITVEEKKELECRAKKAHFRNVSEYIRFVVMNSNIIVECKIGDKDGK